MIYQPDPTPDEESNNLINIDWRQIFNSVVRPMIFIMMLVVAMNLMFPRVYVLGQSMDPSIHEADWLVVSNLDVLTGSIERGEIVTLTSPHGEVQAIKRVIGLPGELIEIEAGVVYVDGQPLIEDYIQDLPRYSGRWRVGDAQYFVLGDNRNNSADSADYGPIDATRIHGVAKLRLFPLSSAGVFAVPDYEAILGE